MLSESTITIVKATAPLVAQNAENLTKHFYQRMFTHNPEVKALFNFARQADGTQQKALANAIVAYASNIDNLGALQGAVKGIVNKHVSLQIKPEHYPIVGTNLLHSIKEVLGDVVTDEILQAWGDAYSFLANMLMKVENDVYQENAAKLGGWEGFRDFVLFKKVEESSIITSFYLKPKDGGIVPQYFAGQYLTIRIPTTDGSTTMRNYSLSMVCTPEYFRISVKKENGGYVSNYLHNLAQTGDIFEIAPPNGEFFIKTDVKFTKPLVLLAAGVGVTPLLAMLQSVIQNNQVDEVVFIHGVLNEDTQAFENELESLRKENIKIYYRYSEAKPQNQNSYKSFGFVDENFLNEVIPNKDAHYYFCGPAIFMSIILKQLKKWNVPSEQINYEFFGSFQDLEKW